MDGSARAAAVAWIAAETLRFGLVFIHQHANDAEVVETVTDLLQNVPNLVFDPINPVARQTAREDVGKLAQRFPRSGFVSRARALEVSIAGLPTLARLN